MEQAGVQLVSPGGDQYIATMASATKATNVFVDATDKGAGKVSAAGQIMIGGLRKVGEFVVDSFAEATKATAAFLKGSVDLAGDFQAGMNEFQVAAGKDIDTKGLEKFHDLFLQLGKDLPVSTSDVQQAAIELVKGGIDPATVAAGGLKQAIQFASAAMKGDLVGAAEISSKIVAGWADVNATAADKATLLTHATDLFTKAANASSTDVVQLSQGIFNAQGIAKTAGVSLDDLATTIAELSGDFSSSAEAGTSLKNMIARLQPATAPATAAMEGLGLFTDEAGSAFYDAAGNFVGFQQASELLQQSLQGLTKEQQAQALQTIFGNDAMAAAAGLAARGGEGYQVMADSLKNAMGVAEAGATIQSGYNIAIENAKGSVEAFQIQLGEHLLPILTTLFNDYITPGINTLSTFTDAVFGSDDAFAQLSPTMQDVTTTIQQLADDFANGVRVAQDIGAEVQHLISWFNRAGGAGDDLGGVIDDLNGVWNNALVVVGNVADGYMAIANAVLPIIARLWDEHGSEISAFVKGTYDSVIEIVNLALELYNSIVPPVLNAVAGFFEAHGSEIGKILTGAGEAFGAIVTGTMETIKGVFHLALDLIHGDWEAAWGDILGIVNAQATAISGIVTGFLDMIAGLFDTSLADILTTWENNWNMAVDIVTKIDWVQAGQSVVEGIIKGVASMASDLFAALEQMAQDAYDRFMAKIKGDSPALEFVPAGQSMVQGIMLGLQNELPALTAAVANMSDDLIKQVQDIGEQINGAIADSFGATASIDRQIAKNLDSFKDVLPEYQQYTTGALKEAQQQAEKFLDPTEGAKFFQKRSDQILEYAKLQKKLSEAQTQEDKDRISAQMVLINKAQSAEISQFDANKAAQGNPLQDLIDQVSQLFNNSKKADLEEQYAKAKTDAERERLRKLIEEAALPMNDTGLGHDLKVLINQLAALFNVPGLARGGVARADQPYWVGEDGPELFWPQMNGMVSPAASSAQMAARGPVYNGQVGNTYNNTMPIYTNNSPAAIQQSWAIMQASMP